VVHIYNSSTEEAEAGASRVPGQLSQKSHALWVVWSLPILLNSAVIA
jgi:hypothetical protein